MTDNNPDPTPGSRRGGRGVQGLLMRLRRDLARPSELAVATSEAADPMIEPSIQRVLSLVRDKLGMDPS